MILWYNSPIPVMVVFLNKKICATFFVGLFKSFDLILPDVIVFSDRGFYIKKKLVLKNKSRSIKMGPTKYIMRIMSFFLGHKSLGENTYIPYKKYNFNLVSQNLRYRCRFL